ncbi:unnamed protein product [Coffea canephora]|uniref:Phosphotransferase n=1 Tax=Coffea canephora TaxID=49390 RepID=A0A068U4P4_COFCA|nr:unnamed protein product [Coffea canephora]
MLWLLLSWVQGLMQHMSRGRMQFRSGMVCCLNQERWLSTWKWGNFRSSHLPLTEYDQGLDAESLNPGEQVNRALYSCFVFNKVLCRMAEEAAFFGDGVPPKLNIPFILRTPEMSAIHHDTSCDLKVVGAKLKDILEGTPGFYTFFPPLEDGEKQKSVVALDGGLFEHYTKFRNCMDSTLQELLGDAYENVSIIHSNDGSGIGAALLAASHSQYLEVEES